MQWYEIFILSILEMIAILLVWSKLNNQLNIYRIRSFCVIIFLAAMAVTFNMYNVNLGFLINFIVLCITVMILFKVPVKTTILQFLTVLIIFSSIQFLFTFILSYLANPMDYSLINGLIVNIATLIVCIIIYKYIIFARLQKYFAKYGNYVITIVINIAGILLLLMYMWAMNKDFVWNYIVYLVAAIVIWEGLNLFFLYQSVRIKEQQKMIYIHEKYMPFLKDMVHEVRQKQHDFKNHLNALYGLAQIEDDQQAKKEIKQYLDTVIEGIKSTDQLLNIKEPILTAIIYSKKFLAKEKGISFNIEFQGEIPQYPLEKHELVELLGNLLDNAIEAAEDSSVERAKIFLTLGKEENYSMIEVKNTGGSIQQKHMDRMFERGFSTKKGKHQGYGLYNVKQIVDYYQGTIELSFDGGCTVFKILF
ncbi:two-component system, AgrA family, sensor histidine kinase AgrC [Anaerovirgula multivorans]|uniref:Two-component system, AgrA family, sensor histidine kinase AgrC n=1 Tax=Anaerovirgula multivorans TaxID=312168 RepID=A0A239JLK3_9FIRM|nr:GHKL domain-containing protein [Anaerovirgula multivorans]SNT06906.1 two-component system, AgrA family, sensor histidine kinase AgrC [Anaerovirgula multivorans]